LKEHFIWSTTQWSGLVAHKCFSHFCSCFIQLISWGLWWLLCWPENWLTADIC